jgi:hypothetical protein
VRIVNAKSDSEIVRLIGSNHNEMVGGSKITARVHVSAMCQGRIFSDGLTVGWGPKPTRGGEGPTPKAMVHGFRGQARTFVLSTDPVTDATVCGRQCFAGNKG